MRGGIAALRLPFGLPFGREHFVVANPAERGAASSAWQGRGVSAALSGLGWFHDLLYRGSAIATPRPVVCQPFGLAVVLTPFPLP